MLSAPIPPNEALRLQSLHAYDLLNTDCEKDFDDLLALAAQIYGGSCAAITFIDKDRQWIKAKKGLDPNLWETPRGISFCAHTILQDDVMIVPDATQDERFCNNPMVTGMESVRFYAGAPIVSGGGYNLGSVCVVDREPRTLAPEQAKALQIISAQISRLLELRLKNRLLMQQAQEQRELEKLLLQKTLQEHEDEKFSIGTELHENIAQGLAAIKFYLELAVETVTEKDRLIRKSRDHIATLVQQVKDLSTAIIPTTLACFNLNDFLAQLLRRFSGQTSIETRLLYSGNNELPAETAIILYRIVEEQLKNIRQHSQATSVVVRLQAHGALQLTIEDNGVGIDAAHFRKGVGIHKVLSLAAQLNGQVHIGSCLPNGCKLQVALPAPVAASVPEGLLAAEQ